VVSMPGRVAKRISTGAPSDLAGSERTEAFSWLDIVRVGTLLVTYIAVSSGLIRFNKFLIHKGRFPYPMALTTVHLLTSLVLCLVLYAVRPSIFPGVASTQGQHMRILGRCIPIALCFAVALYTSNQAYMYCSVAFLQFMKEGNVIIVFFLSVAAGLQVLTRLRVALIFWIITSSSMAVSGDLHFMWIGFGLQLLSQLAECTRNVLGESLLSGADVKLDPLSYTMFVAPPSLVALCAGLAVTWCPEMPQALVTWWHYLLPNALLAFVLNVLVAFIIKEVSAVGFVLTGLCKDLVLVIFSCILFHEEVTFVQACSFTSTMAGVLCWSYFKAYPDSDTTIFASRLFGDRLADKQALVPSERTAFVASQRGV